MWNYVERGGPVMWPLLALSVLGLTVIIWRWWALRQATAGVPTLMKALRTALLDGDVTQAIAICDRHPGPVASIVKAGLVRAARPKEEIELALQDASAHELAALERGLPVLATVAMISPLLGFLGTVTGMINSFEALASVGLNNPAAVAQGISQALITTAAGLMIAIPVQMAYNYFVTRVNGLVRNMESAANVVLDAVGGDGGSSQTGGTHLPQPAPNLAPSPAGAR
ncbi:MAG TPA: MotA/TolQ/ExbB proton channel family protein [Vicinamibacterales bacterium]|nr:MotA/TolQ/ExbB proton channel family protein [Vicinamibacterales bacterium]